MKREHMKEQHRQYYRRNAEKMAEYRKRVARDLRYETIHKYGDRCACCGERHIEFLCIDHKDGGGTKHRESVGFGSNFYRWLKKNGYPDGYQVLCWNCNSAKHQNGECPHQRHTKAAA